MKLYKIIFSPTGGTAKVADAISKKWSDVETIDLSECARDFNISLEEGALALIAMPSFGGLAPQKARKINPIMSMIVSLVLKKACSVAKKNELII